jgi:spore maturation protein CgeB
MTQFSYVFLGLSITSSWGNGHATTYRALVRELVARGHEVLFLERDLPFYRDNRDLPSPPYGKTVLYASLDELKDRFAAAVRNADLVIVGSYVPDGREVAAWVTGAARGKTAFYDIDTPVTLRALERGGAEYLSPELIPRFDLYLSFTGGPTLALLERRYHAARARPLYCSVDPTHYHPEPASAERWALGYLGTYSEDRQSKLEELLLAVARQRPQEAFVVAGPQYPASSGWGPNIEHIEHLPPGEHCDFYNAQRFTLNLTRRDMVRAGYSPSVRLFEAAACGIPILSDTWPGMEDFFTPGRDILIVRSGDEVIRHLEQMPERERRELGRRGRERVLAEHTAAHRADTLERYTRELFEPAAPRADSARLTITSTT